MNARSGAQLISRILTRPATTQARVLATTRRDGALWAHFVVGLPCNIRDIAALALLELHPTSPPSHTCLLLR